MKPMIEKSIKQSMAIDANQSIDIDIIDEQSMLRFFVIIDFIDYQFSSIIDANRSFQSVFLLMVFETMQLHTNHSVNEFKSQTFVRTASAYTYMLERVGYQHFFNANQ